MSAPPADFGETLLTQRSRPSVPARNPISVQAPPPPPAPRQPIQANSSFLPTSDSDWDTPAYTRKNGLR